MTLVRYQHRALTIVTPLLPTLQVDQSASDLSPVQRAELAASTSTVNFSDAQESEFGLSDGSLFSFDSTR